MKVSPPERQNQITLSTLLLELQFTNELAQLRASVSVYQELIAFCLQYAFLSPVGTPLDMRSLPPTADLSKYYIYSVVKPFEVTESIISPYYGKMGLGLQYESPVNVRTLLERGIIE